MSHTISKRCTHSEFLPLGWLKEEEPTLCTPYLNYVWLYYDQLELNNILLRQIKTERKIALATLGAIPWPWMADKEIATHQFRFHVCCRKKKKKICRTRQVFLNKKRHRFFMWLQRWPPFEIQISLFKFELIARVQSEINSDTKDRWHCYDCECSSALDLGRKLHIEIRLGYRKLLSHKQEKNRTREQRISDNHCALTINNSNTRTAMRKQWKYANE